MYTYSKQLCSKFQRSSTAFIKALLIASLLFAGTMSYMAEYDSSSASMKLIEYMVGDEKSETGVDTFAFPFRPGEGCCG